MTRSAKNKAVAQAFAQYAISSAGGTVLATTGRTVPSLRSLAESAAFLDPAAKPASSQAFLDQLAALRAMPNVDHWNDAEGAANDVLEQLFAGKKTVDAAIAEIEQATATELKPG